MKPLYRRLSIGGLLFGGYAVVLAGAAVMRAYPRFTSLYEVQPGGEGVMLQTYATDAELSWRAAGALIALFGASCVLAGAVWALSRGLRRLRVAA